MEIVDTDRPIIYNRFRRPMLLVYFFLDSKVIQKWDVQIIDLLNKFGIVI